MIARRYAVAGFWCGGLILVCLARFADPSDAAQENTPSSKADAKSTARGLAVQARMQQARKGWEEFNSRHENKWQMRFSSEGLPKRIWGYRTAARTGDSKDVSLAFIAENRPFLFVDTASLKFDQTTGRGRLSHVSFTQMHNGIPVEGSKVTVHMTDAGEILSVTSRYHPDIGVDIVPNVGQDAAITAVKADLGAAAGPDLVTQALLVVYFDEANHDHYLAWKISAHGEKPPLSWTYYMDAKTNSLLLKRNNVIH